MGEFNQINHSLLSWMWIEALRTFSNPNDNFQVGKKKNTYNESLLWLKHVSKTATVDSSRCSEDSKGQGLQDLLKSSTQLGHKRKKKIIFFNNSNAN